MLEEKFEAQAKITLWGKIKEIILRPSEFFERIKVEKGVGKAFKYLAVLSLVTVVGEMILFLFNIPFLPPFPVKGVYESVAPIAAMLRLQFSTTMLAILMLAIYGGRLLLSFVTALFLHLFATLLKGRGDYPATYRAYVYSLTPHLLAGWVPWVGIGAALYSLYLLIKGISKLHAVSMLRAFIIAIIMPAVLTLGISIGASGIVYMYFTMLIS